MSGIQIAEALQALTRELIHAQAAREDGDSGDFAIAGAEVELSVDAERRPDGSTGYTVAARSGTRNSQAGAHRLRLVLSLRESAVQRQVPTADDGGATLRAACSGSDDSASRVRRIPDRSGATEPLTTENLKRRIADTFSGGYLTVIAIIQGVALGILLTTTQTHFSKHITLTGHLAVISQALATFTAIVIVTHQYLILTALVRWTPTALDTVIPYALGVGEIGASLLVGDNTLWWASYSVLLLVGAGAFSYSVIRGSLPVFGGLRDFHKQYRESLKLQIVACAALALGCIALSSLSFAGAAPQWVYAAAPIGVLAGGIVIELLGDRDPDDVFVNNDIPWWRFRSPEDHQVDSEPDTTAGSSSTALQETTD